MKGAILFIAAIIAAAAFMFGFSAMMGAAAKVHGEYEEWQCLDDPDCSMVEFGVAQREAKREVLRSMMGQVVPSALAMGLAIAGWMGWVKDKEGGQ